MYISSLLHYTTLRYTATLHYATLHYSLRVETTPEGPLRRASAVVHFNVSHPRDNACIQPKLAEQACSHYHHLQAILLPSRHWSQSATRHFMTLHLHYITHHNTRRYMLLYYPPAIGPDPRAWQVAPAPGPPSQARVSRQRAPPWRPARA